MQQLKSLANRRDWWQHEVLTPCVMCVVYNDSDTRSRFISYGYVHSLASGSNYVLAIPHAGQRVKLAFITLHAHQQEGPPGTHMHARTCTHTHTQY